MATLVTFLLDRSGSMASIKDDTIGAFNAYLSKLKSGTAIDFSFLLFDSVSIETPCVNMPIAEVPFLDGESFQPRASTPLIDAAVKTIKAVEIAIAARGQPDKVVICIQTDGHENSSTEFTWTDLNALIKEKSALGWEFNFMGAGIDSYDQGARMGLSADKIVSYDATDPDAAKAVFSRRAERTMAFSEGLVADMAFEPSEKLAAKDRFDPARKKRPDSAVPAPKRKPIVDDIRL